MSERGAPPAAVALGAVVVGGVLVALHVVRPDVDPWRQPLSAYGLGPYREWFTAALIVWAVTGSLVAWHRRRDARLIERCLWWTFAAGLVVAAALPMDVPFPPTEWTLKALSLTGIFHVAGASLASLAFSFGALIVSRRQARLRSLTILATASVASALSLFVLPFVDVRFFGLAQRVLGASILGWLFRYGWKPPSSSGRLVRESTTMNAQRRNRWRSRIWTGPWRELEGLYRLDEPIEASRRRPKRGADHRLENLILDVTRLSQNPYIGAGHRPRPVGNQSRERGEVTRARGIEEGSAD